MNRVAVQVGEAWLRVATEEGLLAALPAAEADLATVLAGLFDTPPDEVVVVHPSGSPRPPPTTVRARAVRAVPAAVAALAGHARSSGAGGAAVVVDVGHGGAEIARVQDGRVGPVLQVAVGGGRLDAVTAAALARGGVPALPEEARRVREALSLLPVTPASTPPVPVGAEVLRTPLADALTVVVDAVRTVAATSGPGRSPPVLLVGGVARTPLLAQLVDAAGFAVEVAAEPDAAAVTGALLLPATARPTGDPGSGGPPEPPPSWLPPVVPAPGRRSRTALVLLGAAAALAGLLAAGSALPTSYRAPTAGVLVQYGYAVDLPAGWVHTGGLPERRRSLLTPATAPDGSDLISVERSPLGYDAGAEPRRARAELRATFAAAAATGSALTGFDDDARYAGRPVVAYREVGGASAADVDWYVVLDGDAQLSVGCRHTRAGAPLVGAACATVVASVRRTG